jgi:hypothetical protein
VTSVQELNTQVSPVTAKPLPFRVAVLVDQVPSNSLTTTWSIEQAVKNRLSINNSGAKFFIIVIVL